MKQACYGDGKRRSASQEPNSGSVPLPVKWVLVLPSRLKAKLLSGSIIDSVHGSRRQH